MTRLIGILLIVVLSVASARVLACALCMELLPAAASAPCHERSTGAGDARLIGVEPCHFNGEATAVAVIVKGPSERIDPATLQPSSLAVAWAGAPGSRTSLFSPGHHVRVAAPPVSVLRI